ncbi:respiratory nitrate reductase subunit gamma [Streptomyces sp. NPDC006739]|uniref:respiratory nitrate reductase subunit gamma n=1 Tax=Streptomyces sp. NPDC006739 TaxID=3364763 RepID=UPI0036CBE0D1
MTTLLWGALPYVVVTLLVAGLVWRYRYDRFGRAPRSSQTGEPRLLTVASPVFHYGVLCVLAGHLLGVYVPMSWTNAAGLLTVAGLLVLIHRRRTRTMYAVLLAAIVLGMAAKLAHVVGDGYDYRATIAPWVRSLFTLRPKTRLMAGAPVLHQVHAVLGMSLIAFVPYSRLVRMFSAPVQYLTRPYVVYRVRDPQRPDPCPDRRGWERLSG